jgi:hypothetical protein
MHPKHHYGDAFHREFSLSCLFVIYGDCKTYQLAIPTLLRRHNPSTSSASSQGKPMPLNFNFSILFLNISRNLDLLRIEAATLKQGVQFIIGQMLSIEMGACDINWT